MLELEADFLRLRGFTSNVFLRRKNVYSIVDEMCCRLQNTDNLHPQNVLEVSKKQLVEEIDQQTLAFALSSEIRVMSRLLMMPDTLESLRWAASQFWCIHETDNRYWPHIPQYKVSGTNPGSCAQVVCFTA